MRSTLTHTEAGLAMMVQPMLKMYGTSFRQPHQVKWPDSCLKQSKVLVVLRRWLKDIWLRLTR